MESGFPDDEFVGLYIALKPNEFVDLEVAASAAIAWCRTLKAASSAIESGYDYRVQLVEAKAGSSRWLAKIERSKINQFAKDTKAGFEKVPLILKLAAGLAVGAVVTGGPTLDFYFGDEGFTPKQLEQLQECQRRVAEDREVQAHRREIFRELLRDPNVTGLGSGLASGEDWKPAALIPANQFAEAEGLFAIQEPNKSTGERTLYQTLDVILVTPQLENAHRVWTFRQEGLPGRFSAVMRDARFLAALEASSIEERLRLNIPMRIRLEIKEILVDGEWRVKRKGRSILEVLAPVPY